MSVISTAYDALVDRIEAVLDVEANNYRRIGNPYNIEDNSEIELRKGYGIAALSAINTNRHVACQFSIERTFEIVLTRHFTGRLDDADGRVDVEKELLEAQYLIVNDLEQDPSVGGTSMFTRFVGDSGIEYVAGDQSRFIVLRSQFALEYQETYV